MLRVNENVNDKLLMSPKYVQRRFHLTYTYIKWISVDSFASFFTNENKSIPLSYLIIKIETGTLHVLMILIWIHDFYNFYLTHWFGSARSARFGHYKTIFAFYNMCDIQNAAVNAAVPITENRRF